jgi:hypothetical protein
MPDTIRVNEELGIIEIESHGVVSKDDIAASFEKLREILREKDIHKILVDTTKQEMMPTTGEIYELFSSFPPEFKMALLIDETQATANDVSLVEAVTVNRAIATRLFSDRDEAIAWLTE